MLRTIMALALVWLSGAAPPGEPAAQAKPEPPPLARWEGGWTGAGKFFGQTATQRIQWERLLDGKFTRLTMRVENGGKTVFEGTPITARPPARNTRRAGSIRKATFTQSPRNSKVTR